MSIHTHIPIYSYTDTLLWANQIKDDIFIISVEKTDEPPMAGGLYQTDKCQCAKLTSHIL